MHHHTENESSLFSLLVVLSSLSSSLSSPLLSLSLSLSLCLSPCGVVVVVVCGVWCVTRWKPLCMPAPRAHVFSTCARGAGIHGDVLNVYTVKGEGKRVGRREGVVASLVFFIGKTSEKWKLLEILNRTLGSSLIANFLLAKISHMGLSDASEVHQYINTPHHTTPHHPTTQTTTQPRTRTCFGTCIFGNVCVHDCVCVCVHVHVGVHISQEEHIPEHVPSIMCTVPSLWPPTMVECSILDTSADMTNRTAGKLHQKKILVPPGSKTVTLQLLKK